VRIECAREGESGGPSHLLATRARGESCVRVRRTTTAAEFGASSGERQLLRRTARRAAGRAPHNAVPRSRCRSPHEAPYAPRKRYFVLCTWYKVLSTAFCPFMAPMP
jgi:hypothetical protein